MTYLDAVLDDNVDHKFQKRQSKAHSGKCGLKRTVKISAAPHDNTVPGRRLRPISKSSDRKNGKRHLNESLCSYDVRRHSPGRRYQR